VFAAGEQSEIPLMLGFLADEGYELFEVESALTEAELQGFERLSSRRNTTRRA